MRSIQNTSWLLVLIITAGWLSTATESIAETPPEAAQVCTACHGEKGISENPEYPHLAGQKTEYLIQQMKEFRDGKRNNALMTATMKNISDKEITALADYYANLDPVKVTATEINTEGRHVRALCISCHGMEGRTVNPEWPNLAGQHAQYLEKQLMDFKSGARPSPIMEVIAGELSDQQIKDVAEYYSQSQTTAN